MYRQACHSRGSGVRACAALLIAASRWLPGTRTDRLVDRRRALLPRIQCAQCGYPGCRPYAAAIAAGTRPTSTSARPGGDETVRRLATLLGRDAAPLARSRHRSLLRVARIDEALHRLQSMRSRVPGRRHRRRPADDAYRARGALHGLRAVPRAVPGRLHRNGASAWLSSILDRRLSGGVRMRANKRASRPPQPIRRGFLPKRLVLALRQHRGNPARPLVAVGDRVLKGQSIARPASRLGGRSRSSSGLGPRHRGAADTGQRSRDSLAVIVEADGKDELTGTGAFRLARTRIAKVGGARQRSAASSGSAAPPFPPPRSSPRRQPCKTLIVNGAECEPYISCDDALMREARTGHRRRRAAHGGPARSADVHHRGRARQAAAIAAIEAAAGAAGRRASELCRVPALYPAGGERQLIEVLTGRGSAERPLPIEIGFVCQNVGTALAVERLVHARRAADHTHRHRDRAAGCARRTMSKRRSARRSPSSSSIAGATPSVQRLIGGGTMMGYALPDDGIPIVKATNCIFAATTGEVRARMHEWPCIRCGECARACPARLHAAGAIDRRPRRRFRFARDASGSTTASNAVAAMSCAPVTFR